MKIMQASFSSGEISPLLHARVDLARYATGLAELKNMIVLPQGGITRRPGFKYVGDAVLSDRPIYKFIPFEFNSTDTALIGFQHNKISIWNNTTYGTLNLLMSLDSPYSSSDVLDLRYVQSGNVIFLAEKNHKPMILTRESLYSWTLKELEFSGGPFISSTEWGASKSLTLSVSGSIKTLTAQENIFNNNLVGTLIRLEYPVKGQTEKIQSTNSGLYSGSKVQ